MPGRETSIEFFTTPPPERAERNPVKLHTHAWHWNQCIQIHTHHVHLVLYSQECSLLHTPTHLWFVESTLRLFPLFLSLMQHARWNSLIKGIQGSHPSIPYDLPAPVKVTYRLWCLRFALLLMQSWPLRSDVLFQVVNDYHLSMCFSCRTGNPPPLPRRKDCSCGCQCLDLVLTSSLPPIWNRAVGH